jgi:hypothetical protein
MADATEYTPYSTAAPMFGLLPTWIDEYDANRIAAYQIYEQIYWNVPQTFKLMQRGSEADPIYVPAGRIIVDATDRYTATGFGYAPDPQFGTTGEQATAALAYKALLDRERFLSKFHSAKKYGLIRGDWAFHVVADETKPEGRRISIHVIDPAAMFYVGHPDDLDRIQAVHLIEEFKEGDKSLIKRQTYSKGPDPYDPSQDDGKIWSSSTIQDPEEWNKPDGNPVRVEVPAFPLPDIITAIPVYHIRNMEEAGNPWGSSELRGHERLMAALNQGITDEELALALDGLGMYATNSGPPTDDDGNEVNWLLGPGRVVELSGDAAGENKVFFNRVSGVGSVQPYTDHLATLMDYLREGSATPAIASGSVDVSIAESGVALALRMSPMLSKTEVKDIGIRDTMVQMFYDLKFWLQAYEGINTGLAIVAPVFGDKLPINVEEEVKRILTMVEAKIASPQWARDQLAKYGYTFAADEDERIAAATSSVAAASDPFAQRVDEELGGA